MPGEWYRQEELTQTLSEGGQLIVRQLESYLEELVERGCPNHRLVLLSRSRATAAQTSLAAEQYRHVCWYEIFDWLDELSPSDEVCRYLIRQFQVFLEDKAMNLRKVTWEYEHGVAAMLDLTNMMEVAAREALPDMPVKRTGGWNWRGFYLDNSLFFGFRFEQPMRLVFENNRGNGPTAGEHLDLEQKHFLALPKEEQFELIVRFLTEARPNVPRGDVTSEIAEPAE